MNKDELKSRTKAFALRSIRLVESVGNGLTGSVLGKQLLRAATSVGANYRAACKSRSRLEFIAKIGIVEEEADECCYWLELLIDAGLMKRERIESLLQEANELTAIMAASRKSASERK